jgi:hypothetical protein
MLVITSLVSGTGSLPQTICSRITCTGGRSITGSAIGPLECFADVVETYTFSFCIGGQLGTERKPFTRIAIQRMLLTLIDMLSLVARREPCRKTNIRLKRW